MKGEQIIINAHAHSVNYTQCVALSADGRLYGGEVATTLLLLHAIDGTHTARIYECGGEKCMNYSDKETAPSYEREWRRGAGGGQ